jgi:hypothetical protein
VRHAVVAARVLTPAELLPLSRLEQFGVGLGIPVGQQVARPLPAEQQGRIAPVPIQPLTRLLIAMISESSLYIARADDRPTARAAMGAVLDRLLAGLEPASGR